MAQKLAYPVTLTPDETDGGFVVTFEDLPEAITQGETIEEALAEAADALEEAIAGRLRRGDPIPKPSPACARAGSDRSQGRLYLYIPMSSAKLLARQTSYNQFRD